MVIANDFDTTGFSIQTGYYLAKACQAAYDDDPTDRVVELGMEGKAVPFAFDEFHGFIADLDSAAVLAIRGTDSIENWLTDGRVVQIHDDAYPGLVHKGFAGATEAIWQGLQGQLPPPGARPFWVTGHSLGGAMATLAAVRLETAGYTVQATYTYGSPRVGNPDFYSNYQPINYRFVHNDDIVPHVPLELLLIGSVLGGLKQFTYKHVGTLEYLDRHGHLGEGMSDWNAKKAFILTGLMRNGGEPWPQAVEDHAIANYIAAIATNLPDAE